jgi:hydroxymethylpyrimidine kinase/phosphomethylpyrimidine kinase
VACETIELAISPATIPNVLSIAGSDPSGGAGIQADLKTFAALRCHGLSALTALTAQNTQGVKEVFALPPEFVAAEIDALFEDSAIAAVKIGILGSRQNVEIVAERLARHRARTIVLDPVFAASSGQALAREDIAESLVTHLAPLATLITPNLMEAATLAQMRVPTSLAEMQAVAKRLHARGFAAVLVKGGHREAESCDDLLFDGREFHTFSAPRVATRNTHGTGCTLSSAIAAHLAHGLDLVAAIEAAKAYLQRTLETADELSVGKGAGPLNHFHAFWDKGK